MTLMERRMALMAVKKGGGILPTPVYEINDTVVTAGTRISTEIAPLESGKDCTILFDMNIESNPKSGDARYCRFVDVPSASMMLGKYQGTSSDVTYWWMGQSGAIANYDVKAPSPGRFRFCITHSADSDDVTFTIKCSDDIKHSVTTSEEFVPTSNVMSLGYTSNVGGGLLPGTINTVRIYDQVLPDDAINAFFA